MMYRLLNEKDTATNSVIFLVDFVNEFGTFGYASSVNKMDYNLDLLRDLLNETNFESFLSDSKEGTTTLLGFGQYIVRISVKKDKSEREMIFMHHMISKKEIKENFAQLFSHDQIKNIMRIKKDIEQQVYNTFNAVLKE